jgi:hypothetical protein
MGQKEPPTYVAYHPRDQRPRKRDFLKINSVDFKHSEASLNCKIAIIVQESPKWQFRFNTISILILANVI